MSIRKWYFNWFIALMYRYMEWDENHRLEGKSPVHFGTSSSMASFRVFSE